MSSVLYIEGSPKGEHSGSGTIARAFLSRYAEAYPKDEIRTLDLWRDDLATFGALHASAKFALIEGRPRTDEEEQAWGEIEAAVADFDRSDKIVLSCPMWNFSLPAPVKSYIDLLVQPLLTFGFDAETKAHTGLLRDRPVQLILTRSSTGTGDDDFQLPYLRHVFKFIGLTDVRALIADRTTQPTAEAREQYIAQMCDEARSCAAAF